MAIASATQFVRTLPAASPLASSHPYLLLHQRKFWGNTPKVKNSNTRHSAAWIQRQITDRYVIRAQQDNFRSRAAYKLLQMDDKFMFLRKNQVVIDLGCYPGGWSQVAVDRCKAGSSSSRIIGVDLVRPEELQQQTFVQGEVGRAETLDKVLAVLGDRKADIVLCDMAPSCKGVRQDDHLSSAELCLFAAEFAEEVLNLGGWFIVKMLMGSQTQNYTVYLKTRFKKVNSAKPRACRPESREMYFVCKDFIGRPKIAEEVQIKGSFSSKEGFA